MVIVIHLPQVDHAENVGNVDNNSVFEDFVRRQQQNKRQQYHHLSFDFLLFIVVVVLYLFIEK
jgi:hypothetical protein